MKPKLVCLYFDKDIRMSAMIHDFFVFTSVGNQV